MTMESTIEMLEKANADEAFAEALTGAVGDKEGEDAIEAVVAFAAANGFDVTAGDARDVQKQFSEVAEAADGDPDETELDAVSGGNFLAYPTMIKGLFKDW